MYPQVSEVRHSDFVRGYFLQLSDLIALIEQEKFSSLSTIKNGHVFGNLQQAPQRTHWPVRFLSTGKKAVIVRFNFTAQVFFESIFFSEFVIYAPKKLKSCNRSVMGGKMAD